MSEVSKGSFVAALLTLILLFLTVPSFVILLLWLSGAIIWLIAGGVLSPAIESAFGAELDFRLFASYYALLLFAAIVAAGVLSGRR